MLPEGGLPMPDEPQEKPKPTLCGVCKREIVSQGIGDQAPLTSNADMLCIDCARYGHCRECGENVYRQQSADTGTAAADFELIECEHCHTLVLDAHAVLAEQGNTDETKAQQGQQQSGSESGSSVSLPLDSSVWPRIFFILLQLDHKKMTEIPRGMFRPTRPTRPYKFKKSTPGFPFTIV